MTVSKILENTLVAGQTYVTFTDTDLPNSLIRVYSSNSDIIPVSRILNGNTLTVTYEPQTNNIGVAVEIVKAGLDIVDNVTSTDADKALSAKQGKSLKDDLDTLTNTVENLDIPESITDLDDVEVTSITDGQVLAWDETAQKFVNVNQSGGGNSNDYSTNETLIGKWLNSDLYRKVLTNTASVSVSSSWSVFAQAPENINSLIPTETCLTRADGITFYVNKRVNSGNIEISFNNAGGTLTVPAGAYIIIEYTKTS